MYKQNDKYIVSFSEGIISFKVKVIDRNNIENPEMHIIRADRYETAELIFRLLCEQYGLESENVGS